MKEPRIALREPQEEDAEELTALNLASSQFHAPWVTPPINVVAYWEYLLCCNREDTCGYLLCLGKTGPIVGVANLSQIFKGNFCSAYLGYYLGEQYQGQGYMREGLALVLDDAFGELGLHRLEANIQPENRASLVLVKRLGFACEGFSRRYLKVSGEWRDHQRWAMLSEDWDAHR